MTPTRFGILSTARINDLIIQAAAASPEVEIAAVASRDAAKAEAYARSFGIPQAYGSYAKLIADPSIDVVYISLPNSMHCEWSIRALEAGKHVLCEKPMSGDPAQVEAVFDAADANGLRCMEAFMWRHNPQTKRIAELVREGAIGDLRLIRTSFTYIMVDDTLVQMRPELEGGALLDIGCYCVSATRLVGGEPTAATAYRVLSPSGVDARTVAALELPGPVLAQFACSFDVPEREELELFGSEGTLRVDDPWRCRTVGIELVREDGTQQIEIPQQDSYRLQLENLSRAIRGEEQQLLGREDAVCQARAIELVRKAGDEAAA